MKRSMAIMVMVIMGFSAIANGTKDKTKASASNYQEVLQTIEYPTVCRTLNIEGTVLVELKVDKKGNLVSHKIISTPCSDLTLAVERVLPNLTFEVAENNGKARSSKLIIPIDFQLE